jgi:hypothetical protein
MRLTVGFGQYLKVSNINPKQKKAWDNRLKELTEKIWENEYLSV